MEQAWYEPILNSLCGVQRIARFGDYARTHGFVIVSKDTDFLERSDVEGFPPKVIWLDVGNAGTAAIAELLRREEVKRRLAL